MFTPSMVPVADETTYTVQDDFGAIGRVFSETDVREADRQTTLDALYSGQFNDPARVVAFNTREVGLAMPRTNLQLNCGAVLISKVAHCPGRSPISLSSIRARRASSHFG